jgi:hypothetical protein
VVIRLLLAVGVTAALLGYALPAVEDARADRADALAREELTTLRDETARFAARNDATAPGVPGPARLVTVRVPRGTSLRVGVGPRGESLGWVREGRRGRVESDLRFDRLLHLVEPGRHRLRVSLVRRDGGTVVRVRRFKPDKGTTPARVRTPFDRRLPV